MPGKDHITFNILHYLDSRPDIIIPDNRLIDPSAFIRNQNKRRERALPSGEIPRPSSLSDKYEEWMVCIVSYAAISNELVSSALDALETTPTNISCHIPGLN